MTSARFWAGLEAAGVGATAFVGVVGLDGGMDTIFAGVTGAGLDGVDELVDGAGAAFA